jgi:hypothetical protein
MQYDDKSAYWAKVKVKFRELVAEFKERYSESTDPEYLHDIRLGEIQELWSTSDWIIGHDLHGRPIYDGGDLSFAYGELIAGRRNYTNPDHLELDAYLQFQKWLNGEPTFWSQKNNFQSQKPESTDKNTTKRQSSRFLNDQRNFCQASESELENLIKSVETSASCAQRGKSLEELISKLFETVPGLTVDSRNLITETEEIDIVLINHGKTGSVLDREEPVFLVECKNWSSKCGKNEFVLFKEKIENRSLRCSLGFFISWNGFKSTITMEMLRGSRERTLIVPITGKDIKIAIQKKNFLDMLVICWKKSISL